MGIVADEMMGGRKFEDFYVEYGPFQEANDS